MSKTNDVFVVCDSRNGFLTRFECGSGKPRVTHMAEAGVEGPVTFLPDQVETFRVDPPEDFRVVSVAQPVQEKISELEPA